MKVSMRRGVEWSGMEWTDVGCTNGGWCHVWLSPAEYHPPKKVDFVKAWLLKLEQREGTPLVGVERFIDGPYRKHNNNFGFVSEDERNTPQAFSHFTYESSNHRLIIVDIQGVSDMCVAAARNPTPTPTPPSSPLPSPSLCSSLRSALCAFACAVMY